MNQLLSTAQPTIYTIDRSGVPRAIARVNPDHDESVASAKANADLMCASLPLYRTLESLIHELLQQKDLDPVVAELCTQGIHALALAEHGEVRVR